MTDTRSFQDIRGDLIYGDSLLDETEDEITAEGSTEESEVSESASEEQPEGESKSEVEDKPGAGDTDGSAEGESETHDSDESEEKGGDTDGESTDGESEEGSEPTIELDGEQVPLSEVRRWKAEGLMQADYTRKTQETAAERKAAQQLVSDRDALLTEVLDDVAMSSFVKAHPKVLKNLMADPKNTRAILGNAEEVQRLWDDYELLLDRPHLADRVFGGEQVDQQAVENERLAENIGMIANALDAKVDEVAADFEGVDADQVRDYVLSLGKVPTKEGADVNELVDGFTRLYNLMFLHDEESGQTSLDDTLIRNHFDLLSRSAAVSNATADAEADEHNRQVDEQLKDPSSAPSTSGSSKDAPGPTPEPIDDGLTLQQRMSRLRGID